VGRDAEVLETKGVEGFAGSMEAIGFGGLALRTGFWGLTSGFPVLFGGAWVALMGSPLIVLGWVSVSWRSSVGFVSFPLGTLVGCTLVSWGSLMGLVREWTLRKTSRKSAGAEGEELLREAT
jgi:hypothetical protein